MTTTVTTAGAPAITSSATRTVEGLILPYGTAGRTTGGALTFNAGAVKVPTDISRVKLLRDHTGQPGHAPVGYATEIVERHDGLYAKFSVATTPDGDAALADVKGKVRDAFSVELTAVRQSGPVVTSAHLTAVALVAVPAYADARVATVNAHQGETTMPEPDSYTAPDTPDDDNPADAAGQEGQATPPEAPAGHTEVPAVDTTTGAPQKAEEMPRPAATPAYLATENPDMSMAAAANAVLAIQTGGTVHAELADITGTAMGDAEPPKWLGELWAGTAYKRRFAPLVTQRALTNWRVHGWRWTTKPVVGKYSGDKAEIPSNSPAIEDFEAVATRWAGGHDIDRKFWDFKETEFIQSYWRAMAEDYARKSDEAVADFIVAQAAVIDGTATTVWEAMAVLAELLDDKLNVSPTFYLGNPADRLNLAALTQNTAPAMLDLLGVDLKSIQWTKKVPAGTLIAGNRAAVVNSELPGSPLRVEAEHVAKGGRDCALFGYQAIYSENKDGLAKVTFSAEGL